MLRTRVRLGSLSGLILSGLFAVLFTAIGGAELFVPEFAPSYGVPTPLVLRVPYGARIVRKGSGELFDVTFQHHRIVLPRGTVLQPGVEKHRAAIKYDSLRRPPNPARLGSAFVLYFFGCFILSTYYTRFGHPRLRLLRSQVGLFILMGAALALAKGLLVLTALPAFWIPVAAVALWAAVGFDRRTALLLDVAVGFMVASLLRFDLVLLAVLVTRGMVATLLFFNRKQPRQMLLAGLASGVAAAIAYLALTVLLAGKASIGGDLSLGLGSNILACVGGGLASGLLGLMMREPAELAMGHVSRSRLLDLTDIEAPLLRKMASEAPGSWEHSRAMANLAEAAAAVVGADSLLTRVGAYYHDIGKSVQPEYFTENKAPDERSPHDDLPPEVSADAIMAHVVVGAKMLREAGVPEPVVEFVYTHHGTQLVKFFWNKYEQKERADDEQPLDESHFRYPGMKPMSRETAILMLVDSIEATSRTIDKTDRAGFEAMIRHIVFDKLTAGQLDDSGLTLADLKVLTVRMAATLENMYHGRVKYPWQREKEKAEAAAQDEGPSGEAGTSDDGTSDDGASDDGPPAEGAKPQADDEAPAESGVSETRTAATAASGVPAVSPPSQKS
jgi:putative nucleotidyltransferase with HDIG domain